MALLIRLKRQQGRKQKIPDLIWLNLTARCRKDSRLAINFTGHRISQAHTSRSAMNRAKVDQIQHQIFIVRGNSSTFDINISQKPWTMVTINHCSIKYVQFVWTEILFMFSTNHFCQKSHFKIWIERNKHMNHIRIYQIKSLAPSRHLYIWSARIWRRGRMKKKEPMHTFTRKESEQDRTMIIKYSLLLAHLFEHGFSNETRTILFPLQSVRTLY